MIIVESTRTRRIVGRLDRGADLFATLIDICRVYDIGATWVAGLGSVEAVELAEFDQAAKRWKPARRFEGGFEVVSLTGNVSEKDGAPLVHVHATLMRDRDSGVEVLAGHVVSARVFALEVVLDTFDDVRLLRAVDGPTGLTQWCDVKRVGAAGAGGGGGAARAAAESETDEPPGQRPPAATGWADVAAASAKAHSDGASGAAETAEGGDDPRPTTAATATAPTGTGPDADDPLAPGDVILHKKFGRCEIMRIEGAHEFARVRMSNGNLIRLSLEVLDLELDSRIGTRRVFRARVS
jgi:hypothetical protein